MSERRQQGSTSQTYYIMIRNPTTLQGKTGLLFNTALFTMAYQLDAAAPVAITLVTQTVLGAWTSGGFVEMDATKTPGLYRLDGPNAMQGAVKKVRLFWTDTTGSRLTLDDGVEVQLTTYDPETDIYGRIGAPAGASIAADVAAVKVDTAAIKLKTDNLPVDPADASDIAASFSSIASTLATIASYIDTEVAAIKAKTDNLPADPASASTVATATTAIKGDTAAIKLKTDNLPADPADASDVAAAITGVPAAVLAAAIVAPIASEVKKVNGVSVGGTGTDLDPWNPA
jgi:hypothetical protein